MTEMLNKRLATPTELLGPPSVSLHGAVDAGMLAVWLDSLAKSRAGSGPLVLEMSTTGGDADIGRRRGDQGGKMLFEGAQGRRRCGKCRLGAQRQKPAKNRDEPHASPLIVVGRNSAERGSLVPIG